MHGMVRKGILMKYPLLSPCVQETFQVKVPKTEERSMWCLWGLQKPPRRECDRWNEISTREPIARQKLKISKLKVKLLVAAFDLQKVLLCPYGEASSFYYFQRLATHNFTVTNILSMKASCHYWSEAECHKGSCEVVSSLMKYIKAKGNEGFQKFELFCDRCGGAK